MRDYQNTINYINALRDESRAASKAKNKASPLEALGAELAYKLSNAVEALQAFERDLARDPFNALQWVDSAAKAAALLKVLHQLVYAIQVQQDKALPDSVIIKKLHTWAQQNLNKEAGDSTHSFSYSHTLVNRFLAPSWAIVVEAFDCVARQYD